MSAPQSLWRSSRSSHLGGWRANSTIFLSGTAASASGALQASAVLGVIYIVAYFGFVLVAPILLLAAAILFSLERLLARNQKTDDASVGAFSDGLIHKS